MNLTEKMAYLLGLIDGFGIDDKTNEGKVLRQMSEVMKEFVNEVSEMSIRIDELEEITDDLDYTLGELEQFVFFDEDDDDGDEESFECRCVNEDIEDMMNEEKTLYESIQHIFNDDIKKPQAQEGNYEVKCPKCDNRLILDDKELSRGAVNCPKC